MKILIEFVYPESGSQEQMVFEGPEMDIEDLTEIIKQSLPILIGEEYTEDIDLKISEIASGTIH